MALACGRTAAGSALAPRVQLGPAACLTLDGSQPLLHPHPPEHGLGPAEVTHPGGRGSGPPPPLPRDTLRTSLPTSSLGGVQQPGPWQVQRSLVAGTLGTAAPVGDPEGVQGGTPQDSGAPALASAG